MILPHPREMQPILTGSIIKKMPNNNVQLYIK